VADANRSGVFDPVESKASFPELEKRVRQFWERERIFQRSIDERPADNPWVFHEGPPTANGVPGVHHVLARAFKDLFPRYKTMRGYQVVRKAGWDTHGLPVEVEVEKELGFKGKQDIEDYGIAAFNQKCKESGQRYINEWVEFTHRVGYWLDLENPYITWEPRYMESVWALLKAMWDKDLLYTAYKVLPYCPRCATPLSSHELAQGYQDNVKDPSVYTLFELVDEPGTFVLAWTTTPWTLPGNVALAMGPGIEYVKVKQGGRKIILAAERLGELDGDYEVVEHLTSKELVGRSYQPLYTYLVPEGAKAFLLVEADFVDVSEGTGVVHTAAAYGVDDLRLCQEQGLLVRHTVDLRGRFLPEVEKFAGMFVKDADVPIMVDLAERGLIYKKGTIRHTYPFCWRCDTPLLYYAIDSWFIRTSRLRDDLLANNKHINWVPEHIRDGRMGEWLAGGVDWALSRYRYWGTPLPVWVCEKCNDKRCVGSAAELGLGPDEDLHRPHVDEVTLACAKCGGEMRRVPDLIDVWFDSGSMPYAQYHWPFENMETFEHQFPADFICEAIDQTRGWFYSLLAIATLVSEVSSYKNVICLSHVVDVDGKKMSKSRGNVVDPMMLMDSYGADALRWYFYTAAAVGNEYRMAPKMVEEVVRRFFLILWNTYRFFVDLANVDGFAPGAVAEVPVDERNVLDRWLLSELTRCVQTVTRELEAFDATGASRAIEAFVTDLSTWYVRRSRRRFWKPDSDRDKLGAYQTLHHALLTVARLLAPFTPFVAEELYGNLARADGVADSVHLDTWPVAQSAPIDRDLSAEMARARRIVEHGHRARDVGQLKVRQPLAGATVPGPALPPELEAIVLDELNLKALAYSPADAREVVLDTNITPELRLEGLARELVRHIQETRKQAGLNIDDRIELYYRADGEPATAMERWKDHIAAETLAVSVQSTDGGSEPDGIFAREVQVEGHSVWIGLRRADSRA
jgi:isoleucyl-tRNA synthetase